MTHSEQVSDTEGGQLITGAGYATESRSEDQRAGTDEGEKRKKGQGKGKNWVGGPHPRGQSHEERGRRVNLEGMPRQKGKARRSAPTPDTSAFRSVVGRRDGNAAVLA